MLGLRKFVDEMLHDCAVHLFGNVCTGFSLQLAVNKMLSLYDYVRVIVESEV